MNFNKGCVLEQGGLENALAKHHLEIDIIPVWLGVAASPSAPRKAGQSRVDALFWAAGLE